MKLFETIKDVIFFISNKKCLFLITFENYQMKINIFILSLLISFFACVPSKKITSSNYELLPAGVKLSEYIGKKVCFKAKICDFEMQHMLRFSLDAASQHFCIDQMSDDGKSDFQILAYTSSSKIEAVEKYTGKIFTIYGTLNSTAGVGKGGGEHTEYYLEFDMLVE